MSFVEGLQSIWKSSPWSAPDENTEVCEFRGSIKDLMGTCENPPTLMDHVTWPMAQLADLATGSVTSLASPDTYSDLFSGLLDQGSPTGSGPPATPATGQDAVVQRATDHEAWRYQDCYDTAFGDATHKPTGNVELGFNLEDHLPRNVAVESSSFADEGFQQCLVDALRAHTLNEADGTGHFVKSLSFGD